MSRLVLDASAAVWLVIPGQPVGPELTDAVEQAELVVVPSMYSSEVANALWKYVRASELEVSDALAMLDNALAFADHIVPTDQSLLREALNEACRLRHPVDDLVYVVVARRLTARLATCDQRLAQIAGELAVPVIGCQVGE